MGCAMHCRLTRPMRLQLSSVSCRLSGREDTSALNRRSLSSKTVYWRRRSGCRFGHFPPHGPREPTYDGRARRYDTASRPDCRNASANAPRPLRLAYAGPVLRVRGDQLRPERQFNEVGVELFGTEQAEADIEIVLLAANALMAIGVTDLSIDLNVPTLTPMVCDAVGMDDATAERARLALDRKDAAGVAALEGEAAPNLRRATGRGRANGPALAASRSWIYPRPRVLNAKGWKKSRGGYRIRCRIWLLRLIRSRTADSNIIPD